MTETTTAPRTDAITAAHKRALRHADRIIFRLWQGQATIEAYRDASHSTTGFEEKVTIDVGGARIVDYGRDNGAYVRMDEYHRFYAFHSEMSWKYASIKTIRTLIDRIRIGGTLSLVWSRDAYRNEYAKNAALHVDTLHLVISHPKMTAPDEYLVDFQVCADNSARMIQLDAPFASAN
jgi:hypothetical protein